MNFRTTLILLLLVIVIGGVALFLNSGPETPPTPTEPTRLLNLTEADVNHIDIVAADKHIVLDRKGDKWRMSAPVSAPADTAVVQGMLSSILSLRSQGQVKLAGNEQTLGLDQPDSVITLAGKEKQARLSVGVPTGTGGNVYVRVNDASQADLVPALALTDLDKPVSGFRDAQVLEMRSPDIKQLVLTDADGNVTELRKDGNDWKIVRPMSAPADASMVSDVVFALTGLRAAEFVAEDQKDAAKYELDKPVLTVQASSELPSTQPSTASSATILRFGRYDDVLRKNVFAAAESGPIMKVPATALESLQKKPLDLRDRKLLDIDPAAVKRVQIAIESAASTQPTPGPIAIVRAERPATQPASQPTTTTAPSSQPAEAAPTWHLAGGGAVNEAAVEELLRELHPLRVNKYVDPIPTTMPATTVIVTVDTADSSQQIRLIEPPDANASQVTGVYNGLHFEIGKFVLSAAKADFVKK